MQQCDFGIDTVRPGSPAGAEFEAVCQTARVELGNAPFEETCNDTTDMPLTDAIEVAKAIGSDLSVETPNA